MRPPPPSKTEMFWEENSNTLCGLGGLLMIISSFFISLFKAGKRPDKPVAIPTFKPPRGLSPASVDYLFSRKYTNTTFTAALVNMAVKGAMSIRCEEKKKYSLTNKMNTKELSSEERQAHASIFVNSNTKTAEALEQIKAAMESNPALKENPNFTEMQKQFSGTSEIVEVNNKNRDKFQKACSDLETDLEKQWNLKDFFSENRTHITICGIILNVVFALYVLLTGASFEVIYALGLALPFILAELLVLLNSGFNIKLGLKELFIFGIFALFIIAYVIIETFAGKSIHWLSALFFAAASLL
jgi:hypothetical protein